MKTGVYGGTFNPIHRGHLHLLEEFTRRLSLDRVLLIPTHVPPHKAAPDLANAAHRLAMCRLACQGLPHLEVSDLEMRREGKSYTADTLRQLEALYPGDSFYLLMGEDMFLTLGSWYNPQAIFDRATICAVPRSSHGMAALLEKAREYEKTFHGRCVLEDIPYLPISSTQVRQWVAQGRDITSLVPEPVARYIAQQGLYQTQKAG